MTTTQLVALAICVAVFAVGALRRVHIGVLMFAAACGVGVWIAELTMEDVLAGFPIDLLVLLVGVTFFFGVAQANGTVDRLIDSALGRVGDRPAVLPLAMFAVTTAIGSMGSPAAALAVVPMGMSMANKRGIDPMMMSLAMGTGISAGGFAPTSLFGIVTYGAAREAEIALSPLGLFAVALVSNVALLGVAYLLYGRSNRRTPLIADQSEELVTVGGGSERPPRAGSASTDEATPPEAEAGAPMSVIQWLTVVSMAAFVAIVIGVTALGGVPDIGAVAFGLAAALVLLDPSSCRPGMSKIDWSTVLLVCGILTYIGVLDHLGAITAIGEIAGEISVPLLAALALCAVAGLVSAFASTTGMLAAVVPLAVPLVATGEIPGWALICAIAVCASIVDVSPFSTVGATMVATTFDEAERPRMTRLLMRWGLSMVVVGPIAMMVALVVPATIL